MLWSTQNAPFTRDRAIYQWYSNVYKCTVCKVHHCAVCVLMHPNYHYVISTLWYRSDLHASQTTPQIQCRSVKFQISSIQISWVRFQCCQLQFDATPALHFGGNLGKFLFSQEGLPSLYQHYARKLILNNLVIHIMFDSMIHHGETTMISVKLCWI